MDTIYGEARCRVARQLFSPELSNNFIPVNPPKLGSKVLSLLFVLNGWIHKKLVYRHTNLMQNLLLVYFVTLYMFPAI